MTPEISDSFGGLEVQDQGAAIFCFLTDLKIVEFALYPKLDWPLNGRDSKVECSGIFLTKGTNAGSKAPPL